MRLTDHFRELPAELQQALYYLPIETQILYRPEEFRQMIEKVAIALPHSLRG